MASATPDLRLPSEPQSVTELYCFVAEVRARARARARVCVNDLPRVAVWRLGVEPAITCPAPCPLRH